MLPKTMRLTKPAEFSAVFKTGRRVGTRQLAVHVALPSVGTAIQAHSDGEDRSPTPSLARPARVGFVVSSKVGNSVVRHRLTRRLREQMRPLLPSLPAGTDVVVRALPAAAGATSDQLAADLRRAFAKLPRR
jgi:ribonuclease P protein component